MKFLAIDWGEKRIGFAVSDEGETISFGIGTVECIGEKSKLQAVKQKIEETSCQKIVVGIPLNLNGQELHMAQKVRKWCEKLKKQLNIEVILWDERFTSSIAKRVINDKYKKARSREKAAKMEINTLSAEVLLQSYLDYKKHTREE